MSRVTYLTSVSSAFVGEHFEMHLDSLISSCPFGCPEAISIEFED